MNKNDVVDGYIDSVINMSEVMSDRKSFWFEVKNE